MNRRQILYIALAVFISLAAGCGKPTKFYFNPYVGKSANSPEVVHCFDTIGHKKGSFPLIFGGTCCCTPTDELMEQYHRDGYLLDYDTEKLLKKYEARGIILKHENGWPCNNICKKGPHVVFGGKCMVPPTVGTQNFENVITGKRALTAPMEEEQ